VDGEGKELPWDGKVFGDLLVARPLDHQQLFQGRGGDPLRPDDKGGLVPDRDVATIDPDRLHADHRPLQGR